MVARGLPALLLLSMLLAGCGGPQSSAPQPLTSEATPTSSSAAPVPAFLRVRVVDDETVPLEYANVTLVEASWSLLSDWSGRADFYDVEPGNYTLRVIKPYFYRSYVNISVPASRRTDLVVSLIPGPGTDSVVRDPEFTRTCYAPQVPPAHAGIDCLEASDPRVIQDLEPYLWSISIGVGWAGHAATARMRFTVEFQTNASGANVSMAFPEGSTFREYTGVGSLAMEFDEENLTWAQLRTANRVVVTPHPAPGDSEIPSVFTNVETQMLIVNLKPARDVSLDP